MLSQVGLFMIGVILISVAVNLLLVGRAILKEMKVKILAWKKTQVMKRQSTKLSTKQLRDKDRSQMKYGRSVIDTVLERKEMMK